jgi:2-oxoglutarate ferredoxin oxidoreductase subunit beta
MKDHEEPVHELDFIPYFEEIEVEYGEGETREVAMHDGSRLVLHKLERDYDPSSRWHAMERLHEAGERDEVLTGLLFHDAERKNLTDVLNLVDEPLATLGEERTRPSRAALEEIIEEFR